MAETGRKNVEKNHRKTVMLSLMRLGLTDATQIFMDATAGEALHRTSDGKRGNRLPKSRGSISHDNPSRLRCVACLSPHHGKMERWWVHKSWGSNERAMVRLVGWTWMNIWYGAEHVLDFRSADFEYLSICGRTCFFCSEFLNKMELRITSNRHFFGLICDPRPLSLSTGLEPKLAGPVMMDGVLGRMVSFHVLCPLFLLTLLFWC